MGEREGEREIEEEREVEIEWERVEWWEVGSGGWEESGNEVMKNGIRGKSRKVCMRDER